MSLIQFSIPEENISLKELANLVTIIMKELQWAINGNLDVKNIRASSITADRLSVDELSAISANLGKVVAGILVGAYIATADGTYPRIEFSSVGNLLGAYLDATHSLRIEPNVGGAPGVGFYDPSGLTGYLYGNSGIGLLALINDVELTSLTGRIAVSSSAGSISDLVAAINSLNSSVATLTTAVAGKVSSGSSTSTAPVHDHGIPSGTLLAISGGGSVAWVPSGSHSHTV